MNYRTSHQIRQHADRLLDPELADVDGNIETRTGTVSAFNGPEPEIHVAATSDAECDAVAAWLAARVIEGLQQHEIAVFVRSEDELERANAAVAQAGLEASLLDGHTDHPEGRVAVSTIQLAKGLEFRSVAVTACDDDVIPLQSRVESVADDADLEDVYATERHLLYVACTRARDHLLVTGVEPASELPGSPESLHGGAPRAEALSGIIAPATTTTAVIPASIRFFIEFCSLLNPANRPVQPMADLDAWVVVTRRSCWIGAPLAPGWRPARHRPDPDAGALEESDAASAAAVAKRYTSRPASASGWSRL